MLVFVPSQDIEHRHFRENRGDKPQAEGSHTHNEGSRGMMETEESKKPRNEPRAAACIRAFSERRQKQRSLDIAPRELERSH